jgi:uncharacterized MnhB-related membrane protein
MEQTRNRKSAPASRHRADLRLIRSIILLCAVLTGVNIITDGWVTRAIVDVGVIGLLCVALYGIAWLLRDGV